MKRLLLALAVVAVLAVTSFANNFGGTLPPGHFVIELAAPPAPVYDVISQGGPPKTVTMGGVVYTWDEETGTYRAPCPNGDNICFAAVGVIYFEDWPPFPQAGPPTVSPGILKEFE